MSLRFEEEAALHRSGAAACDILGPSMPLSSNARRLSRDLTFWPALFMVIGSVIGVNIFIKPAVMAQALPSAPVLLAIWALTGLVSLAGALLYAELGAALPWTGGDYVYLREAFGEMAGFLYVWMTILIRATLNVAMYALAIGGFLSSIVPLGGPVLDRTIAVGAGIKLQFGWHQIAGLGVGSRQLLGSARWRRESGGPHDLEAGGRRDADYRRALFSRRPRDGGCRALRDHWDLARALPAGGSADL